MERKDDFETWAVQNLGQAYGLEIEDHVYVNPVTRWAYKAWRASRGYMFQDSYSHAYRLGDALRDLLDDAQHAKHPSCEDGGWCPVRDAREALKEFDAHLATLRSLAGNPMERS